MIYKIQVAEKIEKKLSRIPKKDKEQIIKKIDMLVGNPRPEDCKKPSLYRIRAGNYRIIYTIRDKLLLILVVDIGHRKNIYSQ